MQKSSTKKVRHLRIKPCMSKTIKSYNYALYFAHYGTLSKQKNASFLHVIIRLKIQLFCTHYKFFGKDIDASLICTFFLKKI